MYAHRERRGPPGREVDLAFTDRRGGVSAAPFGALNLALAGDDDPAAVAENLRRVLADFAPGDEVADLQQVHGREVVLVESAATGRFVGDGLVTRSRGVVLMVRAADCVPVLLADPDAGVVGAVHAGRAGVLAGVVTAALELMGDQGARQVTGWIGPHVCGRCYEVPPEMQEEVSQMEPTTRATTSWGTPALDLGAGVRSQLERAGAEVVDVARCTRETPDLHSHRRDGRSAGRLAGLIRLRSGA